MYLLVGRGVVVRGVPVVRRGGRGGGAGRHELQRQCVHEGDGGRRGAARAAVALLEPAAHAVHTLHTQYRYSQPDDTV